MIMVNQLLYGKIENFFFKQLQIEEKNTFSAIFFGNFYRLKALQTEKRFIDSCRKNKDDEEEDIDFSQGKVKYLYKALIAALAGLRTYKAMQNEMGTIKRSTYYGTALMLYQLGYLYKTYANVLP